METIITWKNKFFSNKIQLYHREDLIGEIVNKAFSRSADGELNGRKLRFDIKGFFRQETRILDARDESVIAEVVIGTWKSKATIRYNNKEYLWQYENFWNSKWSITSANGPAVKYHSHGTWGEVTSYTNDEILILTGLFIKNYFRQRAATAAAAT